MLFGKRDKKNKPDERVLHLKARVDALKQADDATRDKDKTYTLDHFLEGDDVLTGREIEDNHTPTGASSAHDSTPDPGHSQDFEVNLAAELQKYIERQEAQAQADDAPSPAAKTTEAQDWSWSETASSAPTETPAAAPWPGEEGWLTPDTEENASPEPRTSAWPEGSDNEWPSSKEWPVEEAWPPRDEAV